MPAAHARVVRRVILLFLNTLWFLVRTSSGGSDDVLADIEKQLDVTHCKPGQQTQGAECLDCPAVRDAAGYIRLKAHNSHH